MVCIDWQPLPSSSHFSPIYLTRSCQWGGDHCPWDVCNTYTSILSSATYPGAPSYGGIRTPNTHAKNTQANGGSQQYYVVLSWFQIWRPQVQLFCLFKVLNDGQFLSKYIQMFLFYMYSMTFCHAPVFRTLGVKSYLIRTLRPPRGVCEAHLHYAWKRCVIAAIPSQSCVNPFAALARRYLRATLMRM